MKSKQFLSIATIFSLTLVGLSCKKSTDVDATKPLQQSFQTAEPEVKKAIDTVNTSLKSGNYADASKALEPIVTQRVLTEPQRQAVSAALFQINKAVSANPALDSKEMYDLRLKMYKAVDSPKRF
jgi:outer membrane protein assembly factor BamD (BamD/ComL family)